MSTDTDLDGDVFISPRHLAAALRTGDPPIEALTAIGWDHQHDNLGNAYVTAPDRRVRLGYLPEGEDDGLWRISAYADPFGKPVWGARFNESCPTEIVTAFTRKLAELYEQGSDAYLAAPIPDHPNRDPFFAVVPLLRSGWELETHRWGALAVQSADKLAALELTTGKLDPERELTTRDARWQLWAGTSADTPAWYATASTLTPIALLRTVTECLADPTPVVRWREETYTYVQDLATVTPVMPEHVRPPTPLDVRHATARRPKPLPAVSVPRWSTTTSRPARPSR
ncbi:DUF317 domain-containing protein [Streptomyces cyaneofuscatus]|uniref:DUF317 domain-containing protein n=1 Tax=Streptomyces cyaneofuscatus TaxID=66883 RepID=UPI0037FC2A14